jgi:hypothetical protein
MFISHKMPLAYGRGLVSAPVPLTIPTDPGEALAFAAQQDRAADISLAEGRYALAERLSHLALEARCRATGCRA